MSPNMLVHYLQTIKVLPQQAFHWEEFESTALCVDVDGQRTVYQLDLADHVIKVYQASSQTEMSGDFHFDKAIPLTDQQLAALPKQTSLAS